MTLYLPNFPIIRPRRLRRNAIIRNSISETTLKPSDFIMPIFIKEGINEPEPIPSMPGQYRFPVNRVSDFVSKLIDIGVNSIILFGIPKHKDNLGSEAYNKKGIVQRAVSEIKHNLGGEVVIYTDVCLCQYTDHGHCGLVLRDEKGYYIDNDKTLKYLQKIAISHAEAGADFVAPSGMIDGMVKAIRSALDKEGFEDVGVMSYSVKYASSFYGPFREAAYSAPKFGDRRSHQMDPRNVREALKEAMLDVSEGADIIMVKPALPYLDIINLLRRTLYVPIAAYSVSGEYSMIKAAAEKGWIDEKKIVFEALNSIKRAGADLIITYYALEVSKWIKEGYSPF